MAWILIAEHDLFMQRLMEHAIKQAGYETIVASDGVEAIEATRRRAPDLIVTALDMPKMNGYSLITSLRRRGVNTETTPIMVVSGQASRANIIESIKVGANDFVSKLDVQVDVLLEKIDQHLAGHMTPEAIQERAEARLRVEAEAKAKAARMEEVEAGAENAALQAVAAEMQAAATGGGGDAPSGSAAAGAPASAPAANREPIYPVPEPEEIGEFLTGLLGKDVEAKSADPIEIGDGSKFFYSLYVNDDGETASIGVSDIKLSANAAAALALIPAAVAKEAVASGELDEEFFESYREITNIAASLFNTSDTPHVKLETLYHGRGELPEAAVALLDDPVSQLDIAISIPDYADGHFSIRSL